MIAKIGWGTKSVDYNKLRKKLNLLFPNHRNILHSFVCAKKKILKAKLDEFADKNGNRRTYWGMGDDSFDDLTAHIIGLGKETYYKIMRNPILAKEIKYKESFMYVFHED